MSRSSLRADARRLPSGLLPPFSFRRLWGFADGRRSRSSRFATTPRLEPLEERRVLSATSFDTAALESDVVFTIDEPLVFDGPGTEYPEFEHTEALELVEGTVAVSFTADSASGFQALFSKDHSGFQDGGHLTAFVKDGLIKVRLQSDSEEVYLYSAADSIIAGEQHHVAVSFGPDGYRLFVDGLIADAEVDFDQDISQNENPLVLGASAWSRQGDDANLRSFFEGTIHEFTIYSAQYELDEMAALAGLDLTPLSQPTVIDGVLHGTDRIDWLNLVRYGSVNSVLGGYSTDLIQGTPENDRLDGGHGEDLIVGGAGDDVLVSRSDGREPVIAQNYGAADDPNGEVDPRTKTLYPDQPIASDDLLVGGPGADTFRFEILINAKERILFKHVNDDGTIDWKGVTGENNLVHDHWVDRIGDELIYDFNRDEGDKIEIVGHTSDVYDLTHEDLDGDGVLDASVLWIQSNQGNAGAHNKDKLGRIFVLGDLVRESDYTVHAHANLGIVETIGELAEALAPRYGNPVVTDGESRWLPDRINEGALPEGAVFAVGQELQFDGEKGDAIQAAHTEAMELPAGTVAMSFTLDSVDGRYGLFSKDHTDFQDGGHLTAFVENGVVKVRLQTDSESYYLHSAVDAISPGEEHHVAVSFGPDGFRLFVDGLIADAKVDLDQNIAPNDNPLVIGATAKGRNGDDANLRDFFRGTIHDFTLYEGQFDLDEMAELAGLDLTPLSEPTVIDGVLHGTDGGEWLSAVAGQPTDGGYGDDVLLGTDAGDRLDGGHGEDVVYGGAGNDILVSRSDGREPVIAQLYDGEDDPYGEVDPNTLTVYPDQPIVADDVLMGGPGADTFRFEILINAKERILFKHVNDDGTIDWQGVTGENRLVHDHWVDRIGNDLIMDFNRAEGDKIEVVGHTSDVYKVTHEDLDGDGVLDASILWVQSNQGNAGAHNKDKLGRIYVLGDLVRESDYTVHAHANLGIVETIGELGEALAPKYGEKLEGDGPSRWLPDEIDEAPLPGGAVFAVGQELQFSGEEGDYIQVAHSDAMELPDGTVAFSFTTDSTAGRQALFSKDHSGFQQGGHLTAFLVDGRIKVRLQSDSESVYLHSDEGSIVAGQQYEVAVSFGSDGFRLYIDDVLVDSKVDFTQGIGANNNPLAIGANAWSRNGERANLRDFFAGTIHSLAIYDAAFEAINLAPTARVSIADAALALLLAEEEEVDFLIDE